MANNLALLNALEHGCKWRGQPRHFGSWHTIYMHLSRWSKASVVERAFARLQAEQIIAIRIEAVGLDNTSSKVHPDSTDARPRFIWSPRLIAVL